MTPVAPRVSDLQRGAVSLTGCCPIISHRRSQTEIFTEGNEGNEGVSAESTI